VARRNGFGTVRLLRCRHQSERRFDTDPVGERAGTEVLLFTVRIWPEEQGAGGVEWRGKVQHLPGGSTAYFRDWDGLISVIQVMVIEGNQGTT
jgi:hypothetical protein